MTLMDNDKLLVLAGGTLPTGGVSPGELAAVQEQLDGKAPASAGVTAAERTAIARADTVATTVLYQGPNEADRALVPDNATSGGLFFYDTPAPKNAEFVRDVTFYAMTAGTQQFHILDRTGDGAWVTAARINRAVVQGWNTLQLDMPIREGQIFAVSGGRIGYLGSARNRRPYIRATGTDAAWTLAGTGTQLLQYRVTITARSDYDTAILGGEAQLKKIEASAYPVERIGMTAAQEIVGVNNTSSSSSVFVFGKPAPRGARRVTGVRYLARAAGTSRVAVLKLDGATFKTLRSAMVTADAAGWIYAPVDLEVNEGEYLGMIGGVFAYTSGTSGYQSWFSGAFPDFTANAPNSSFLAVGFNIALAPPATFNAVAAVSRRARVGILPLQENIEASSTSTANRHFVYNQPAPKGTLRAATVRVFAMQAGVTEFGAYTLSGLTFSRERFKAFNLVAGWNDITLDLAVNEGEYLGATGGVFGYRTAMIAPVVDWFMGAASSFTPDWSAASRSLLHLAFDLEVADGHNTTPAGRFFGTRGVLLGDSISTQIYSGGWFRYAAEVAGCVIQSYAISGGNGNTIVNVGTEGLAYRSPSAGSTASQKADYTNASFVMIQIGTNPMTIGTLTDIPTETIFDLPYTVGGVTCTTPQEHWERFPQTYVGSIAIVTEYIRWRHPEVQIYYITPPVSRPERVGPLPELFAQLGKLYGVTVFNAQAEAGIPDRGRFPYLAPNENPQVHPSLLGNQVWGRYVGGRLIGA